jgi:hypothetical protein
MHIKDLDLCRYHTGPFDADNWSVSLRAVGWLEHPQHFTTGVTSSEFVSKSKMIVEQVRGACPDFAFLGFKECSLCLAVGLKSPGPIWSQENIFIPGSRVVYVAPGGIVHYVEMHEYLPPSEFVESVLSCPDPHSKKYYEALRASNAGVKPPFQTAEDLEKQMDSLLRQLRRRD